MDGAGGGAGGYPHPYAAYGYGAGQPDQQAQQQQQWCVGLARFQGRLLMGSMVVCRGWVDRFDRA